MLNTRRVALGRRLEHRVGRGHAVAVALAHRADDMAHHARRIHRELLDRADAVFHHRPALAQHQRERQVANLVLAGDDLVRRVLREERRPHLERALVEDVDVIARRGPSGSQLHDLAVVGVEGADRRLGDDVIGALGVGAAHLDERNGIRDRRSRRAGRGASPRCRRSTRAPTGPSGSPGAADACASRGRRRRSRRTSTAGRTAGTARARAGASPACSTAAARSGSARASA